MTIEITTPAADRGLLTIAQLRDAAGLSPTDTSQDVTLTAAGLAVSDTISQWCCVAGDGLTPPTLLKETITETLYLCGSLPSIDLSRRFVGDVSVVEDGATLEASAFMKNANTGRLYRLYSGSPAYWCATTIVVTYDAGFTIVPTPLADVAREMVQRRVGQARDPLLKSVRIEQPGVETVERQYWVDATADTDITPDMEAKLAPYRSVAI